MNAELPDEEKPEQADEATGLAATRPAAGRRQEKPQPAVELMYFGYASVCVRGPVSGKLYQFSRQLPVLAVDGRDAVSMLKTRLFRRIR